MCDVQVHVSDRHASILPVVVRYVVDRCLVSAQQLQTHRLSRDKVMAAVIDHYSCTQLGCRPDPWPKAWLRVEALPGVRLDTITNSLHTMMQTADGATKMATITVPPSDASTILLDHLQNDAFVLSHVEKNRLVQRAHGSCPQGPVKTKLLSLLSV